MQVDFYQLSRDPAEAVVPLLARNTLKAGQRLLVVSADDDLTGRISERLWAGAESFLAHGLSGGPHDARQPILLADVWKQNHDDLCVVSPDTGGVVRARAMASRLEADLAIIDKRRPKANVSEVMNIIGDVTGRTCVIVDDMVDTAGTLVKAAQALKEHGAARVVAYCTHAVLSGPAIERIAHSAGHLAELVVTDPIPLSEAAAACPRIRQLSVASLLAETILRVSNEDSVSSLLMD